MKRIAIFIDGTFNRTDSQNPTNVVRLSRCVKHFDRKTDTPQMVIYSPGVGSGRGNTALGRKLDRVFGGSLGWGLLDIIAETYRNLVIAYEQGDEVYIFGFSRGAFAARSLAGMIRSCGIAPRSHLGRIPEAVARYVSRAPKPIQNIRIAMHSAPILHLTQRPAARNLTGGARWGIKPPSNSRCRISGFGILWAHLACPLSCHSRIGSTRNINSTTRCFHLPSCQHATRWPWMNGAKHSHRIYGPIWPI